MDDLILIEVGVPGPAGTGVSAGDWNTIRSEVDVLKLARVRVALNRDAPDSTTLISGNGKDAIADTPYVFGAGTWSGLLYLDATIARSVGSGNGRLYLRYDAAIHTTTAWDFTSTPALTNVELRQVIDFPAITGSTTHYFGVYFRGETTAGTTYLSKVRVGAEFRRNS